MIDMLGHVTKRGINTQRSATNSSRSLPLICRITRGETLLPLTSNFSSLLTLPILLFFWSQRKYSQTIPNFFLAQFQLHLLENILRQFQIISIILPGPLNENFTLQSTQLRYS